MKSIMEKKEGKEERTAKNGKKGRKEEMKLSNKERKEGGREN